MSTADCRCGEPSSGRCAYCRRALCLDCADPHDAQCQKRIDAALRERKRGAVVVPGVVGATEDTL